MSVSTLPRESPLEVMTYLPNLFYFFLKLLVNINKLFFESVFKGSKLTRNEMKIISRTINEEENKVDIFLCCKAHESFIIKEKNHNLGNYLVDMLIMTRSIS